MKGKTMSKVVKKVIENDGSVIYIDSKSDKQNKTIQLNPISSLKEVEIKKIRKTVL